MPKVHTMLIVASSQNSQVARAAFSLKAPFRLARAAFPHLKVSGTGRVINVASLSGKRGEAWLSVYSACARGRS